MLDKIKEFPRHDQQIIGRILAQCSKSHGYYFDIKYATLLTPILKHFSNEELKKIFGDKSQHYFECAQRYANKCFIASSYIASQESETKEQDLLKNLSKPKFKIFLANCFAMNKLRLDYHVFISKLISNSNMENYTITNQDYYESQSQNPHLEYDQRDEAFKREMQRRHRTGIGGGFQQIQERDFSERDS